MKLTNHKKRGTNRTRHARKCKRNKNRRTRSQRGGVTKAEVFDKVIGEFSSCTKDDFRLTINHQFGSCENFNKLLEFRNKMSPDLKTVVCTRDKFLKNENLLASLLAINPDVKGLKIQNLDRIWREFVGHLTKVVDSQYEVASAADIKKRLCDLKLSTSAAAAAPRPSAPRPSAPRPSSVAPRPSSVAPRPSSIAEEPDTRLEAPLGFYRVGNVWQNENGVYYLADFFKPRAPTPSAPASALTTDALEKRLAQIKNPDYNPPDLSPENKRHAKEFGADLPDILTPWSLLEYKLAALLDG